MCHAFLVGEHAAARAPGVGAGHVQCSACVVVASRRCQLWLAGVVPLEDAVAGDAAVHDGGQGGHLQVFVGGDEAAAVATALGAQGEGHHVAALQSERADAVVQLLVGEGVHESTAALQTVVAALLALEVRLAIHGEGFCGVAVGQDDAATVVELHLAVLVVHGLCAANLHILGQQTGGLRWLHALQDEHGVLGVLDVH